MHLRSYSVYFSNAALMKTGCKRKEKKQSKETIFKKKTVAIRAAFYSNRWAPTECHIRMMNNSIKIPVATYTHSSLTHMPFGHKFRRYIEKPLDYYNFGN